ncbi:MAG TPA: ATP-binding protein [Vicinamibacterales bacterium]|nr:ATP-binding protein [Vicinamibacterales bacterium]
MSSPETYQRLFEAVHEGVYIGRVSRDGSIPSETIAANPHLRLMFGFPAEGTDKGPNPFDAGTLTDPRAREAFFARLERDGSVADYLLRLRRADGSPMWVEVTAHAECAGDVFRIDSLMRDVSERKRLETQARDLYHQLLQAEKMAALGQTISGVAHELNNPLATILTWAERLAELDVPGDARRGIETILQQSERAARIVRNLLTFARKRHTTRTMVDLNAIVRETLALRAYDQRVSNISTIDALAAGLPQVFADPHQIQQVLLNLVINGEQAMLAAHGRGTLIVRTWHDAERDLVILEVSDDGPGVPEDVQTKIFDPFFTTKEVGKGTGLGLTVAYAIVQEHGGDIRVSSAPGGGATFTVEVPAGVGALKGRDEGSAPATSVASGTLALVVEDEEALAVAVAEALSDAGFTVDRASDGEQALARVHERPYDVIVCDLKMPRVDGMTFYRTIVAEAPALAERIIFMTGDVAGTDAERFLDDTGCRWLAKPFRLSELLRVARGMLA